MSFDQILVIDWETSGLHRDADADRSYDRGPQGIEIGAVVIDAATWQPIGDFVSRVRFDNNMIWDRTAEAIHGITQHELAAALPVQIVAERFDRFLGGFFRKGQPILMAGQNPAVDRWYTHQLFHRAGYRPYPWRFHSRMLDTFTIGFYRWGCTTGDQLYQRVCGVIRGRHSAYEDARLGARVLCEAFGLNTSTTTESYA